MALVIYEFDTVFSERKTTERSFSLRRSEKDLRPFLTPILSELHPDF